MIVEGKLRNFNFLAEKTWLQFYLGSLIKFNIEVSVSFFTGYLEKKVFTY